MVDLWDLKMDSKHRVADFFWCALNFKAKEVLERWAGEEKRQNEDLKVKKKKKKDGGGREVHSAQTPHALVWVKGQDSTTTASPCLQQQGSIEGHELTLSVVCQYCLNLRPANQTFETFAAPTTIAAIANTTPPSTSLPSPSHNTSPRLCLHPSFHLSILSHSALSGCQSEQDFVTPWEGCLAPLELSWALFVHFFCVCVVVWRWGGGLGYGKHLSVYRHVWVYIEWSSVVKAVVFVLASCSLCMYT